jgi:four helix bundle protein
LGKGPHEPSITNQGENTMSSSRNETRALESRFTTHETEHVPEHDSRAMWQAGQFDYQRLDVYRVARQALLLGEDLCPHLPRGYGKLREQLRRALLSSYLNIAEASSRAGKDRRARFRISRGEASEAAAAVEAITLLKLAPDSKTVALTRLLQRSCAMLTRLAQCR